MKNILNDIVCLFFASDVENEKDMAIHLREILILGRN